MGIKSMSDIFEILKEAADDDNISHALVQQLLLDAHHIGVNNQVLVPVSWQYRAREVGDLEWREWEDCPEEGSEVVSSCSNWEYETRELYASAPGQYKEPVLGMYTDMFDDLRYLITGFENGCNANDYSSEISLARSGIRKARNWLHPLPTDEIDNLISKSLYGGVFDFRIFARDIEKNHGIGYPTES